MYRVKTVAEMLGVPRNTLIAWERRLGIVAPARTGGGYRAYSEEEVALLRRLKSLVDGGLKVSEAWALIQRDLQRGPAPAVVTTVPLETLRARLLEAMLAFDGARAELIAGELSVIPIEQQLDVVLFPMMHDIGSRWERGEASVAQEHFASAWVRERMITTLCVLGDPPSGAPEVVCATPSGERHELGLLGIAIRLALRRFRVLMLGADVPLADLVETVAARSPFGVCVSLVHERPAAEVVAYARELRRRLPSGVRVALGGRGVRGVADVPGVAICEFSVPAWADVPALAGRGVG